jgi:hypothetical protein
MKSDERRLEIQPDELDLLAWNVANEVINGFKVEGFSLRVGVSVEDFKRIANHLRSIARPESVKLSLDEARVWRNALGLALDELGDDEFETRTGYSTQIGNRLVSRLTEFIDATNQE